MGKYDLRFDTVESAHDVRLLEGFLMANPGTYDPAIYEKWLAEVCLPGVANGERRAMAWFRRGRIVGDAILKAAAPDLVELKHFRVVAGELHGRGLAAFMMRQVAPEAQDLLVEKGMISSEANTLTIRLDTTAGGAAESYFLHNGFVEVGREDLYVPGREEVLMQREVQLQ